MWHFCHGKGGFNDDVRWKQFPHRTTTNSHSRGLTCRRNSTTVYQAIIPNIKVRATVFYQNGTQNHIVSYLGDNPSPWQSHKWFWPGTKIFSSNWLNGGLLSTVSYCIVLGGGGRVLSHEWRQPLPLTKLGQPYSISMEHKILSYHTWGEEFCPMNGQDTSPWQSIDISHIQLRFNIFQLERGSRKNR